MKRLFLQFILSLFLLLSLSFNAESEEVLEGIYLQPTGDVLVNGKVFEGATVILTETGDVVILGNADVNESAAVPCYLHERIGCDDRCPQGKKCDGACETCIDVDVNTCTPGTWEGSGCYNGCPDGQYCSANCNECVIEDPQGCTEIWWEDGTRSHCIDHCPFGWECPEDCGACVPVVSDPSWECQIFWLFEVYPIVCIDNCPDGLKCDEDCIDCI